MMNPGELSLSHLMSSETTEVSVGNFQRIVIRNDHLRPRSLKEGQYHWVYRTMADVELAIVEEQTW